MSELIIFTPEKYLALEKAADSFSKSSLIPAHLKGKHSDVFIIMSMAFELDIPPVLALNNLNVIQGKPTIPPQMMIAMVRRKIADPYIKIEVNEKELWARCTTARNFKEKEEGLVNISYWDMARARQMGLAHKDNYQKQPTTMLKWRAVAESFRVTWPDVIMGMMAPEEFQDFDGKIIEINPTGMTKEEMDEDFPVPDHEKIVGPDYRVQNGKFRGKQFKELTDEDLEEYAEVLCKRGAKQKPWERELHTNIVNYLNDLKSQLGENPPPPEEEIEEAEIIPPIPPEADLKEKEARTAALKALYALCGKVWKDKSSEEKVILVQNVLGIPNLNILETWPPNQIMNLMQRVDEWVLRNKEPPLVDPFPMDPKDWPEPDLDAIEKQSQKAPVAKPSFKL